MDDVVANLIAADDSEMLVMSMLRGQDFQNSLATDSSRPRTDYEQLAGPFAHVIIDEAQELTDAEWRMLVSRCRRGASRSWAIEPRRATDSRSRGRTPSGRRAGPRGIASLTINYRTPEEVMAAAEPVIRAALPDANVPRSVRRSGVPVKRGSASELATVVDGWLSAHDEGTACVIGDPSYRASTRVSSLTPELAKGLEFDLVMLVDPGRFGEGIEGAVDRYVAMTRATQQP